MSRGAYAVVLALVVACLTLPTCRGIPDPPPGSQRVVIETSDGERLDAIQIGRGGDVAALSHGATGTKEDFYALAAALARDGWRVVAYDARASATRPASEGSIERRICARSLSKHVRPASIHCCSRADLWERRCRYPWHGSWTLKP